MAIQVAAMNHNNGGGGGDDNGRSSVVVDEHEHDLVMPGFRFYPTEEELIEFYLRRKVEGKRFSVELITFLDLYRYDPWELPAFAAIGEKEWFFYVPRDRKYRNGDRPNRVTTSGYWKATGADRMIRAENSRQIGLKKTLVFYSGKAPKGIRSSWIMNEYRLPQSDTERYQKAEISLCRVYKRSGVDDYRSLPATLPHKPSSSRSANNTDQTNRSKNNTTTITATAARKAISSPPQETDHYKNNSNNTGSIPDASSSRMTIDNESQITPAVLMYNNTTTPTTPLSSTTSIEEDTNISQHQQQQPVMMYNSSTNIDELTRLVSYHHHQLHLHQQQQQGNSLLMHQYPLQLPSHQFMFPFHSSSSSSTATMTMNSSMPSINMSDKLWDWNPLQDGSFN